jgi:cytochrome b
MRRSLCPLIAIIAGTAGTGWLLTTDAFWGSETMQAVHSALADGLLALVGVHLGGVALASLRHRENLVRAMVVGLKRRAERDDIT